MLHFMDVLLSTIEPANQFLQKRNVGFRHAMPVIEAVIKSVENFRADESFERFIQNTEETLKNIEHEDSRPRRIRQRSSQLTDSVVMETLGESSSDDENQALKSAYLEVIDYILNEMDKRFHNNSDVLMAISELNNMHASDFDRNVLKPLENIGLVLPPEADSSCQNVHLERERQARERK